MVEESNAAYAIVAARDENDVALEIHVHAKSEAARALDKILDQFEAIWEQLPEEGDVDFILDAVVLSEEGEIK